MVCLMEMWGENAEHSVFNPIGDKNVICESQGHQWEAKTFEEANRAELRYRACQRCDRYERFVKFKWEVNEIRPSIA